MAKQTINTSTPNSGKGDSLFSAFTKINANFSELYAVLGISEVDLDNFATKQYVDDAVDAIEIPDVSNFITAADIPTDFKGSVFADDSTLLVDAVNASIPYSVLSGAPTIPANLNDLSDVNTISPANGDLLTYANGEWVNAVLLNNIVSGSNISLLNNDAGYITAASIPTDFKGSVFADDSTLLVDGVNGVIPGTLTGSWNNSNSLFNVIGLGLALNTDSSTFLVNNTGLTLVASEGTRAASLETSVDRFSYDVTNDTNSTSFAVTPANLLLTTTGSILVSTQGSVTMSSGSITASANGPITISNNGNVSWAANGDFSVAANNININSGGIFANTFTGDVRGSVFADDSTLLVDAVNGTIVGPISAPNVFIEAFSGNATMAAVNDVAIISGQSSVVLSAGLDVGIRSNLDGSIYNWFFKRDGVLEFPDGGSLRVGIAPSTSVGQAGDVAGTVAFDNDYIYYCVADFDSSTIIWKRVAWSNDVW
jgi:inosine/xanthosine triphosphate pyrophosphatase family protein